MAMICALLARLPLVVKMAAPYSTSPRRLRTHNHRALMNPKVQNQHENPRDPHREEPGSPRASCWASATTELMQALHYKKYGERVELDNQDLIAGFPSDKFAHPEFVLNYVTKYGVLVKHEERRVFIKSSWPVYGKTAIINALEGGPLLGILFQHTIMMMPQYNKKVITMKDIEDDLSHMLPSTNEDKECPRAFGICPFKGPKLKVEKKPFCAHCGFYGRIDQLHIVVLTGYRHDGSSSWLEFKNSYGEEWGIEGYGRLDVPRVEDGSKDKDDPEFDDPKNEEQVGLMDVFRCAYKVRIK